MNLRRSTLGLLLFLLALLSRTTAPYAMTQVVFDPIANAPICFHDGGSSQQAPKDGGAPVADHQHCALACCQAFVPAPDTIATPAYVVVERRLDWRPAPATSEEPRFLVRYPARGPPVFS